MKDTKMLAILVVALGLMVCPARVNEAVPMSTTFTYQGRLIDANSAAEGLYDFQFKLYNDPCTGVQQGSTIDINELDVIDGYFTVELDFGSGGFTGEARWLEIGVRPGDLNGSNTYTVLSPRQELTPTPYAIYAEYGPEVEAPLALSGSSSEAIISGTNTGSGDGVHGEAWGVGISGKTLGSYGWGVYGYAPYLGGRGVYGYTTGSSGRGVYGKATRSNGIGVCGEGGQYDFYAAGSGINYGPFTGAHEVRLSDNFPEDVEPGMIVSVTGQAQVRHNEDGTVSISSTLPTVKLSDVANDKAVFGVLVMEAALPKEHWYQANETERFATVNALGEGRVWVCNINGQIETGDYITTSSIPGYGQKQYDNLLRSCTLGKAIETVDWDSVTGTIEFNGQTFKTYLIAVVYTSG